MKSSFDASELCAQLREAADKIEAQQDQCGKVSINLVEPALHPISWVLIGIIRGLTIKDGH